MTLIATFTVDGFPMVFGDLLLTGPNQPDRAVAIPAQGEVQEFFGTCGWGISGLTQKLNLVSENCVIAWAGSWIGAKIAISGLKELAQSTVLTPANILKFLESEADLRQHEAGFVGLVHDGNALHQFQHKAEQFHSGSLGNAYICGTGAVAFQEFSQFFDKLGIRATPSVNKAIMGVSLSLMLGGWLLQLEHRGGTQAHSLLNMFGAGYEIAFFSDGRIQKLPDVTYLLWEARVVNQEVMLSLPKLIVRQTYSGDYLLVASAMLSDQDGTPTIANEQRHVISPMFDTAKMPTADELRSVSLQSRLLSHSIVVYRDGKELGIHTIVRRYGPDSELGITFNDQGGQVVLGFRQDALDQIVRGIKHFIDLKSQRA